MYEKFLTTKSTFFRQQTIWLLLIFIGLRVLSYFTFEHPIIQGILVFGIMMAFAAVYFKNTDWAWSILLAELFLGGAGHFLEIGGISLRSVLVSTFLFLWIMHHLSIKSMQYKLRIKRKVIWFLIPLILFVIIGMFLGLAHGHGFRNVIADTIPFSYLILLLPFYHQFKKRETKEHLIRLLLVFILGSALFAFFTFVIYSGGFAELQNHYYDWFRNIAMGKITDMGTGFFRIVVPEHLFIVPAILLNASLLMRDEKHHKFWRIFLFLSLLVLMLDFSRTYMLALAVGLLVLKYKHSWKRWLIISATVGLLAMLIYTSISIAASGGKTLGLELFGIRFLSLVEPTIEASTYARSELLEPIFAIIKTHPVLGVGLGASLSFYDSVNFQNIVTTQFDWGYFEIMAELGVLGLLAFLALIFYALYNLIMKVESITDYHDFYVGILAGLISLIVMAVTTPALTHVLGIFLLVITLTIAMKPVSVFEEILQSLYRVFHRIK